MAPDFKNDRFFRNLSFVTLAAVYLLIAAGSIVRSTGAGMGCPDWPKCFGAWAPPSDISLLPSNYKEIYAAERRKKNIRLASLLDKLGFHTTADRILHESVYKEEDFSYTKAMIEYVNRLWGVVFGGLVLVLFILSVARYKFNKNLFWISFMVLLFTLFQGWLGSLVVSTNLLPGMVTVHMFFALLITAFLVIMLYGSNAKIRQPVFLKHKISLSIITFILLALSLVQIFIGTQVRHEIDEFVAANIPKALQIGRLSVLFHFHRMMALLVVVTYAGFSFIILSDKVYRKFYGKYAMWLGMILTIELAAGLVMAYNGIPAFAQPIHLTVASLMFGVLLYFIIYIRETGKKVLTRS